MMKERRHGRSEGKRGEEASAGGREQRSEGEEKGMGVGGREIGREGNFKGGALMRTLASIYTAHTTTHTRPLPLRLWYYTYKIVNGFINSVL